MQYRGSSKDQKAVATHNDISHSKFKNANIPKNGKCLDNSPAHCSHEQRQSPSKNPDYRPDCIVYSFK